jgi:hypothetical protein
MGSKVNLAREHQKARSRLQPKIHLHLLLGVFHHLGSHHLLLKVSFPFLVVFHSHEEDYHYLS